MVLESTDFPGGRLVASHAGGVFSPLYFQTDHLGSVRAVVSETRVPTVHRTVVERNDYHPYGLTWSDAQRPVTDNRYRYNGKEDQAFLSVGQIDYGARHYNPLTGRWFTPDELSEKYFGVGAYVFCANNPMRYVDNDGRKIVDVNGNILYQNGNWTIAAKGTDAMRIGTAMMQTRTGGEKWNEMVIDRNAISMVVSQEKKVRTDKNGNLSIVLGVAEHRWGENERTNITIYEGSINAVVNDEFKIDPIRLEIIKQQTQDERIGSEGVHEGVHAVDKTNRDKNLREKKAIDAQREYSKEVERKKPIVIKQPFDNNDIILIR